MSAWSRARGATIVDTRKTTPGLRALEKYAVRCGGGINHRFGLDDAILIKDNHVAACGGVGEAVRRARAFAGHLVKVEVEVDGLDQLEDALKHGPDVVMLDNFSLDDLKTAVSLAKGRAVLEASGGVNLTTVRAIAETGVDVIERRRPDPLGAEHGHRPGRGLAEARAIQRDRVLSGRKVEPVRTVVKGRPHRLGDIGLACGHGGLGEAFEDRTGEVGIGGRDQVLDTNVGVLRETCGRAVTRLHQLHPDAEMAQLVGQRARKALDGLLAGGIGGRQRHGGQGDGRRSR